MTDTYNLYELNMLALDIETDVRAFTKLQQSCEELESLQSAIIEHGVSASLIAYTSDINLVVEDKAVSVEHIDITLKNIKESLKQALVKIIDKILAFLKKYLHLTISIKTDCDEILKDTIHNVKSDVSYKWKSSVFDIETIDVHSVGFNRLYVSTKKKKAFVDMLLTKVEDVVNGKSKDDSIQVSLITILKNMAKEPLYSSLKSHNTMSLSDTGILSQILLDTAIDQYAVRIPVNTASQSRFSDPVNYVNLFKDLDFKGLSRSIGQYSKRLQVLKTHIKKSNVHDFNSASMAMSLISILIQSGSLRVLKFKQTVCANFQLMEKVK